MAGRANGKRSAYREAFPIRYRDRDFKIANADPPWCPSGKAWPREWRTSGESIRTFPCQVKHYFHFQLGFVHRLLNVTLKQCIRLAGLVVRRPPQERKIRGSSPACTGFFFSWSSHTGDLIIDTPVATLPGAWRYSISSWTGRPGVSIL